MNSIRMEVIDNASALFKHHQRSCNNGTPWHLQSTDVVMACQLSASSVLYYKRLERRSYGLPFSTAGAGASASPTDTDIGLSTGSI
jgi:hypothetical protein